MFLVIVDVQQSVEWKVSEQLTVIKNSSGKVLLDVEIDKNVSEK